MRESIAKLTPTDLSGDLEFYLFAKNIETSAEQFLLTHALRLDVEARAFLANMRDQSGATARRLREGFEAGRMAVHLDKIEEMHATEAGWRTPIQNDRRF